MKPKLYALIPILMFLMIGIACQKDNPVQPDDGDHDHAEAVGLVILLNDTEIVRYEAGDVTGQIEVKAGEQSPLMTVLFIDEHDGELFTPEGDQYAPVWEIGDTQIAEADKEENDPLWSFRLTGLKAGTTVLTVNILHEGHADFVSQSIPILVTE